MEKEVHARLRIEVEHVHRGGWKHASNAWECSNRCTDTCTPWVHPLAGSIVWRLLATNALSGGKSARARGNVREEDDQGGGCGSVTRGPNKKGG